MESSTQDFRYSTNGTNVSALTTLNTSSERAHIWQTGSTFTYQAPNTKILPPQNDILCQHCRIMSKTSKILHQPPKINWLGEGDEPIELVFDGDYEAPPDIPKFEAFAHHNTIGNLKRSATRCQLCALLIAFDPEFPDLKFEENDSTRYTMKILRADAFMEGPGVLKLDVKGRQSGVTYLRDGRPWEKGDGTLKFERTDHVEVFKLARGWLEECVGSHDGCLGNENSVEEYVLPTRLLQVEGSGSTVSSIKLCLGKDLHPLTRYLTLSHCWGGANDILKLTENTLEPFQTALPLSRLPKNFLEAATITKSLGYEYLWIDSLCIIQDQPSGLDWKTEASKMGAVYRNSLCTIAALGAKTPHGGCFQSRDLRSFTPCQLLPNSEARTGIYAENWRMQDPHVHASRIPMLHTRGWVVQERALALRTLYFGAEMVYWECTCTEGSERFPGLRGVEPGSTLKGTFFSLLQRARRGPWDRVWMEQWWGIIQSYTTCNLSFASDRWPAISGVLSVIEKACDSRLVFGLWEVGLAEEMLWEVVVPRQKGRLENGTPSWSWLSVEAEIHKMWFNLDKVFRMDAKVFKCFRLEPGVSRPIGLPKLIVRARMMRLKWNVGYYGDGRRDYKFRLWDEKRSAAGVWDGNWSPDLLPDSKWDTWAVQFVVDDQLHEMAGLVVRPVAEGGDTWVRVGVYVLLPKDGPDTDSAWNLGEIRKINLV